MEGLAPSDPHKIDCRRFETGTSYGGPLASIDTKELEALKIKREIELEQVKVSRLKLVLGFVGQFKWLLIAGGIAAILGKIGALPKSFEELVKVVTPFIPGK